METLTAPFAAVGAPGTPAARTPSTPGVAVGAAPGGEPVVLAVGSAGGRDRRRRVVATVAVSLVGAAAVSTAVFQAVSGASTSVPMTDPSAARDTVGVWPSGPGAVVPTAAAQPGPGAPAGALPPPIASLELRAQQGVLPPGVPVPAAGPGPVLPAAPPVAGAPAPTSGRADAPVVHAGGGGRGDVRDGDGDGGGDRGDRGGHDGRGGHHGGGGWGGPGGGPSRPSTTPTTPTTPPSSSTPPPPSAPTEARAAPADAGGGQTVTNAPTNTASAG